MSVYKTRRQESTFLTLLRKTVCSLKTVVLLVYVTEYQSLTS
jgi:hypothetical protein